MPRAGNPDEALRPGEEGGAGKARSSRHGPYQRTSIAGEREIWRSGSRLRKSLKRDPASLPAFSTLLSLYIRQGRIPEAVRRFSALVQQNPQNAGLHFLLGLAYFEAKDLDKSEANVRQAVQLDPSTPNVIYPTRQYRVCTGIGGRGEEVSTGGNRGESAEPDELYDTGPAVGARGELGRG